MVGVMRLSGELLCKFPIDVPLPMDDLLRKIEDLAPCNDPRHAYQLGHSIYVYKGALWPPTTITELCINVIVVELDRVVVNSAKDLEDMLKLIFRKVAKEDAEPSIYADIVDGLTWRCREHMRHGCNVMVGRLMEHESERYIFHEDTLNLTDQVGHTHMDIDVHEGMEKALLTWLLFVGHLFIRMCSPSRW